MSLKQKSNPENILYGQETEKALENFQISQLTMPRMFIRSLGLLKHACAKANRDLGKLEPEISTAIQRAAIGVAEGIHDDQFNVDVFQTGSGTSTNMNANEVIAKLASASTGAAVHPNDHVNCGQSSNDIIPSCIHISAAFSVSESLLPALDHLADKIDEQAHANRKTIKTGRTHLMDAVPMTFAQELSGWSAQIKNAKSHIEACLPQLLELAVGGSAIGTGINTHPQFGEEVTKNINKRLNLQFKEADNHFAAISSQDAVVALSGSLRSTALSLSKIANDLRWLSSGPTSGLGEITLKKLQAGSSIMPGKVNPVIPESVLMACTQVQGNDFAISLGGQAGNFQLNTMLPLIAFNIIQSIELLSNASTALAEKAIDGMTVNHDHISDKLWRNPILVTSLVDKLGYDKCAEIAEKSFHEQRSVLDVAEELSGISRADLKTYMEPSKLTNEHRSNKNTS
ncbi:MAG: class II fumarate hydratase [Glaciecola sp.]|jgi:fumarate hydratase class II